MRLPVALSLLLCCVLYCGSATAATKSSFAEYESNFLSELWRTYPTWATSVGYHTYDSLLPAPNEAYRARERKFATGMLSELKKFDVRDLSDADRTDYYLIENQLNYILWSADTLKEYQWNPALYNVCGNFADLINSDYMPLELRLRSFAAKMKGVKAYYAAARANIGTPTLEHLKLAMDQNKGGQSVFKDELNRELDKASLSVAEKAEIRRQADSVIKIIDDYVSWLKEKRNGPLRTFRLGQELYERKFYYENQSRFTAQEIYKKANVQKMAITHKMVAITEQLWPKYFNTPIPKNRLLAVKSLIDTLSLKHVKAEDFQETIEHLLPRLTAFVKKKDLLTMDPTKPLVVRKEPDYMAGVAGASISAPGPYEKRGNTFYNVGGFKGWASDRVESYLREYNDYILQILNIHEAIPGHYTQLVYANKSKSLVKAILGNNTMIEGWAVYAERMMLEAGYDIDSTRSATEASPEMWLMYYKWHLRSICNTLLDYGVHVKGQQYNYAMHLLVDEAFQEKAEAENKWKRVTVTQTQLCCYFTGFTEIYEFREEYKGLVKNAYSVKNFNEQFLGFGSAPTKYIRTMMLEKLGKY
ncbi:MAG: DUF885 domain-containing protein [Chitinophagia bacterium]|nr:DUF885 domain-containing protein [Chitinophagia bacterium]